MPRNAKNASRVARQRQHDARVNSWMAQFDVNGSGRLERPELAALLTHIHPQKEPPQERILDMLITQATEVRTYSMHLPGDPSGAVPFDKIMKVVNAFTAYTLASAAFDSIGAKGVLSLAELPSLISKANLSDDASAMSESEVGMLLGSAAALRMPTTAPNTAAGALHARRRLRLSPRMQDYDLGRKEFDLLELQSFRRETILQYSLINRTEQLRILLLALSAPSPPPSAP